jgi:hypothetical protein
MTPRNRVPAVSLGVERLEDRTLPSYAFTSVAEPGRLFRGFEGAPAINTDGAVAFHAQTGSPVCCTSGIFRHIDFGYTQIAGAGGKDPFLGPFPALNDAYQVAFVRGFRQQVQSIEVGDGGTPYPIVTLNRTFPRLGSVVSLNTWGTVAFQADQALGGVVVNGIFTGDGETITTVVDTSGGRFTSFGDGPSLNDSGMVAFQATFATPPTRGQGIYVAWGDYLYPIAQGGAGTRFTSFGPAPAINQGGTVVFYATLADGTSGIFAGDGSTLIIVARTQPRPFFRYLRFNPAAALNNNGQFAFMAAAEVVRGPAVFRFTGIFTGDNPLTDRVIATGDRLFGSTVDGLAFFRQGLNDSGQITFRAHLADGRTVIARADPIEKLGDAAPPSGAEPAAEATAVTSALVARAGGGRVVFTGAPGVGLRASLPSGERLEDAAFARLVAGDFRARHNAAADQGLERQEPLWTELGEGLAAATGLIETL